MTIEKFSEENLQAICDVLADTYTGLTGSEIYQLLSQLSIPDINPTMTKRHRLFSALVAKQKQDN